MQCLMKSFYNSHKKTVRKLLTYIKLLSKKLDNNINSIQAHCNKKGNKAVICFASFVSKSVCGLYGNNNCRNDVGEDAAAAECAEQHPAETDKSGINAEVLCESAAYTAEHIITF